MKALFTIISFLFFLSSCSGYLNLEEYAVSMHADKELKNLELTMLDSKKNNLKIHENENENENEKTNTNFKKIATFQKGDTLYKYFQEKSYDIARANNLYMKDSFVLILPGWEIWDQNGVIVIVQ